jgi:hypothetical protein
MSWARDIQATLGRPRAALAGAACLVGISAFVTGVLEGHARGTYGTLIGSWLFFAGGALGAATFAALFRIISACWAPGPASMAHAALGFAPVALALLIVVLAGAGSAPWVAESRGWLATPVLVARELVLGALLLGAAWLWFGPRSGPASLAQAVTFLIAFSVVLSVWAFDFVLGPDPVFGSTIIGPWVFVSAFLAGADLVILLALARDELSASTRRDAASFLLAVTVFWAYLFAAQALTIWYGNLPDETEFLLRRLQGGWGWAGLVMLVLVFGAPFAALLHPAGRSSTRVLGALLGGQLVGLWVEFQVLVVPSLTSSDELLPIHPRAVLVALGMLGAFVLCLAAAASTPTPDALASGPERRPAS